MSHILSVMVDEGRASSARRQMQQAALPYQSASCAMCVHNVCVWSRVCVMSSSYVCAVISICACVFMVYTLYRAMTVQVHITTWQVHQIPLTNFKMGEASGKRHVSSVPQQRIRANGPTKPHSCANHTACYLNAPGHTIPHGCNHLVA